MISLADVYHVLASIVPLYVAMILAYASTKWWKIFDRGQNSGINKFVAKFSIPLLSFHVISTNNPYEMNIKLISSDAFQKLTALLVFAVVIKVSRGSLDWLITGFSLSTLPNTLVVGLPLLKAMYGDDAVKLLGQIVVLQSIIWYSLLLFLFEFRAAKAVAQTPPSEVSEELEALEEQQSKHTGEAAKDMSPRKVKTHHILLMIWKKLMLNPNTYASLAGLVWALISFRWRIELPKIIGNSISILSDGGLGMAMFSLGLFMASQPKIIACGNQMAALAIALRFILGPTLMAMCSYAIGLRGKLLRIAIVQAALPQGIVPFVFAKEYDTHPNILSTGLIVGMLLAVPVTLAYYFILGS